MSIDAFNPDLSKSEFTQQNAAIRKNEGEKSIKMLLKRICS